MQFQERILRIGQFLRKSDYLSRRKPWSIALDPPCRPPRWKLGCFVLWWRGIRRGRREKGIPEPSSLRVERPPEVPPMRSGLANRSKVNQARARSTRLRGPAAAASLRFRIFFFTTTVHEQLDRNLCSKRKPMICQRKKEINHDLKKENKDGLRLGGFQ